MSIYVNDLILQSLKTVRLATLFQGPRPEYVTDALSLLREITSTFNASGIMIPYQTDLTFDLVADQKTYRIGVSGDVDVVHQPFVEVNYITIHWQGIQYPITIINDLNELSVFKATNIQTLPDAARVHQVIASDTNELVTEIIFFNAPSQVYECRIRGKATLVKPDLQDDITGLPDFYKRFLRLWVAKEISRYYPTNGLTAQDEQDLLAAENLIRATSDLDLWVRTPGYLTKRDPFLYNTRLGVIT